MRRHLTSSLALLAAVLAAGCRSNGSAPPHPMGAESFLSPAPGAQGRAANAAPTADGAGAAVNGGEGAGAPRTIEEADVYKLSGSTLYVLNAYRGLQIVDLSEIEHPRLLSRVPLTGTPVDLYVRGAIAFVAVSDSFQYVVAGGEVQPRRGSRLYAIDVADPAHPKVVAELAVEGQLEQTRLVGDVLYVVSRRYAWYDWRLGVAPAGDATASAGAGVAIGETAPSPEVDTVFVASFDVRNPTRPAEVARLDLAASGWDTHANVTPERITLSFAGWDESQGGYAPVTHFQVVDISDPGGALAQGAAFQASGQVQDRWGLDYDAGTGLFRAVLATGWNSGASLELWTSPGPGEATWLNRHAIPVNESLTAARFDGDRAYIVTARATDPLWIVDTSDPRHLVAAKPLEMPGQLDFIEPRGERLVALGHERPFQLVVSLIDVTTDPPSELARVRFGSGWSWVGAQPDDLRKAFLVLDAAGLILVPVQGWDASTHRFQGGTQLVGLDLAPGAPAPLTLGGFLAHPGAVKRAFPANAGATRLVALSDGALQTIGADDHAKPVELGRIDLARSVATLAVVHGKAVELCGDWYSGDMELAVTDALDPDAASPLARVSVAAPTARMFQDGDVAWLLAHDWSTGKAWLQAVDLADPVHPLLRGRLDLAPEEAAGFHLGYRGYWGYGDEAVLAGHALAIHRPAWGCGGACPLAAAGGGTAGDEVRVYDLADPDHPRFASAVSLGGTAWSWGLRAFGSYAWITHYEWEPDGAQGRFYADRIDLTDPASPKLLAKINVPGVLFTASADGKRVFTLETFWKESAATTWAHGLELTASGTARLFGSAELGGYPAGADAAGGFAWIATSEWSTTASSSRLWAVDLGAIAVASHQNLQGSWTWLDRAAGGKLFLQAGWHDQGVLVYALRDPARPTFERFVRTPGWVWDIAVAGGWAYLPSGPYGVPTVQLSP